MSSLPYWILFLPSAVLLGACAVIVARWTLQRFGVSWARWRRRRSAWPRAITALVLAIVASGCATTRPDYYSQEACYELRREARRAGTNEIRSAAIATGLGAGGAVAPLVGDTKALQIGLAIGVVIFGAIALGADHQEKEATAEWGENCAHVTILDPQPMPSASDIIMLRDQR